MSAPAMPPAPMVALRPGLAPLQVDSAPGAGLSAERLLHTIESAAEVHRRGQFFLWLRQALDGLLPHELAVCGAWQRNRREVVFDGFPAIVLAPGVQAALGQPAAANGTPLAAPAPASALLRELQRQWILLGGRAAVVDADSLRASVPESDLEALHEAGFGSLLVHGVARPQRPNEIETLFAFAATRRRWTVGDRALLELLMPMLSSTYLRMQTQERALGASSATPAPAVAVPRGQLITERERQILRWMREGKRNTEIGVLLEISALTVKNHVQKILRKLGAANRAQAVALAMSRHLL